MLSGAEFGRGQFWSVAGDQPEWIAARVSVFRAYDVLEGRRLFSRGVIAETPARLQAEARMNGLIRLGVFTDFSASLAPEVDVQGSQRLRA